MYGIFRVALLLLAESIFVFGGDHPDFYQSRVKRTIAIDQRFMGHQNSTVLWRRYNSIGFVGAGETFAEPFEPILRPCDALIGWFTEIAVNFTECITSNSLPPRVCTRCVDNFLALESAYYELKDNREIKSLTGVPCSRVIFRQYETAYIENLYQALVGEFWVESRCSDCLEFVISPQFVTLDESLRFSKSPANYHYNNKTTKFLQLHSKLYDCIEKMGESSNIVEAKKNSTVICNQCWKPYQDLSLYYEESVMMKWDFCVDVDSAINDTIRFWREDLRCALPSLPTKQSEAVYVALISLAFFTTTILFYLGSFMQGARRKQRLRKYQSYYATYGTSGTINSDIIHDFIAERRQSIERHISAVETNGERTPLLFSGGRRTISYSLLPPSNLG